MKRWFYILLGGLGVGLALASMFLIWQSQFVPPSYQTLVAVVEYVSVPLGLGLGCMGLINGRRAGEFDIAAYNRASRKRDHHVSGAEIEFECPMCHKGYRASPLLAGKPFTCRECREVFDVPKTSSSNTRHQRALLPGTG
jgi:hypothetical protein